jgi:hypothetical protein
MLVNDEFGKCGNGHGIFESIILARAKQTKEVRFQVL